MARTPKKGNGMQASGVTEMDPVEAAAQAKLKKCANRRLVLMIISMVIMLLVGVGLIVYPTVADAWNRHVASRAIAGYSEQVANTPKEDREGQLRKAREYNESLLGQGNERFRPNEEEKKIYNSILDVSGTGIMGYIAIPAIHAKLPIYHGTDETVLQIAAGHYEGSSFPIGGESTHAVIAGHTGLPSAQLFTGIDGMKKGDKFSITVYDDVLTYEVEDRQVVLPDNVKPLAIQKGRDLVSLVTCTPYGVNSHRLILTAHRIPTPENKKEVEVNPERAIMSDIAITAFVILGVAVCMATIVITQRRRRKTHAHGSHTRSRK